MTNFEQMTRIAPRYPLLPQLDLASAQPRWLKFYHLLEVSEIFWLRYTCRFVDSYNFLFILSGTGM
jgi:hypothetical protein